MGSFVLEKRLSDVFALAQKGSSRRSRIIDVGSDHGHLAAYAVKYGGFFSCICTDIHEAPARRSEEFLSQNGLSSVSSVYCTNGLTGIDLLENDTIVMAGLGGNNIMDIMNEVLPRTSSNILPTVRFVFQPQKTIEGLREYLCSHGFAIEDESISMERGIYYPIISAVYDGKGRKLTLKEKYYGPVLLAKEDSDNNVKEYFLRLQKRHQMWARGDPEVQKLLEES
ncbi:MAG: SAM-dependent methyltransferase [Clostridiales bacterium]|nr:SAM-dependent methyltransferase [Clostridiales bacterium]